jgi:hypothetical protein
MQSNYFVSGMHKMTSKIICAYFNVSPIIECFVCVLLHVPVATKLLFLCHSRCLLRSAVLSRVVVFLLEI